MGTPLYERYRPGTWQEVVGQDRVVNRIKGLAQRGGLAGKAYWIAGGSGTGKSTIARLIAHEVADDICITEVDASALTVAALRELERDSSISGWGERGGRAYVVNESHGLRRDVIRQLLVTLERIPGHVAWIFTTTTEGQESLFEDYDDASPLLSRCIDLSLSRRGLAEAFAARVQEIAIAEGLDGRPIGDYIRLAKDCRNNCRSMIQHVESGAMLPE